MPRRGDTELVDAVARESSMTRGQRLAFGAQLEAGFIVLEGRAPNAASVRARDAALSPRFKDDFGPAHELAVRGPRRCRAESWELATPDGLLVVAGSGGALQIGPRDG